MPICFVEVTMKTLSNLVLARTMARLIRQVITLEISERTLAETVRRSIRAKRLVFSHDIPFSEMLERKAVENGDRVFLVYGDRRITYRQMNEYANRVAHRLMEAGARPGDGVGILMTNSPEFLFAFYGSQKAGCYTVPINTGLLGDGLEHIVNHSEIAFLFVDHDLLPTLEPIRPTCARLRKVVVFHEASPDTRAPGKGLENMRHWTGGGTVDHNPGLPAPPDAISYLMYTSGTTGMPKGVVYRLHNSGVKQMYVVARTFFSRDDVFYTPLPLFHANALNITTLMVFGVGGRLVLGKRFSASRFWNEVREHGVTTFNALGAMIPILLKQPPSALDAQNRVRLVISSACPANVWHEFQDRYGVKLLEAYGAVDGGGFACFNVGNAPAGSIGKPLSGRHRIVGEDGRDVPPGEPGELVFWVGKQNKSAVEYFKNEEATREKVRDGWLHTGDQVTRDKDGFLYFVGRLTESMRRRGENVSAYEVETQVTKHPDVLECAAYGVPSELGEHDIMITVAPVEGRRIDVHALHAFLHERLAKYAVPRYVRVVPEIPKTATHRVMKKELEKAGVTGDTVDMERREPPP